MSGPIPGVSPEHCSNPEDHQPHAWALGLCDGSEVRLPLGPEDDAPPPPAMGPATLWGAPGNPVPWNLAGLSDADLDDVLERLATWVGHYNRTYATKDERLVLGCWREHPAVVWELASLYAAWVDAFDSATATAREAASWHERLLPRFQERLTGWFGEGTFRCNTSQHKGGWNTTSEKLGSLARVAATIPARSARDRRAMYGTDLSPHPR